MNTEILRVLSNRLKKVLQEVSTKEQSKNNQLNMKSKKLKGLIRKIDKVLKAE